MKVALCLSGVVGKLYTNKKGYQWEGDIDFKIGHHFFKKHLLDINDVDVFIHCWDEKYEDEIVKLYKPKKYIFEKQIEFEGKQLRTRFIKSRWYGAKQVMNLKKEYEEENGFTYDAVMWARFDVGIFKDFKFTEIVDDLDAMYIPDDNVENKNGNILDYWYFSSSKNMDLINSLYDWGNKNEFNSPHRDLYTWTKVINNIDIYSVSEFAESEIGNGNTDIIRAVF